MKGYVSGVAIPRIVLRDFRQFRVLLAPKEVQQAFCEIKKVFIESGDVSYGAMADFYFDPATIKIQQGE